MKRKSTKGKAAKSTSKPKVVVGPLPVNKPLPVQPPKPNGRPSKYEGATTVAKIEALTEYLRLNPTKYLELCTTDQLATALGVCRDTLNEWGRVHPELSDAIKKWTTTRNATLMKLAAALPPAIWIFMTKNMLGWRDQTDVKHGGEVKTQSKMVIEVVQTKLPPQPQPSPQAPKK
ncbi:MAG: hypothetical protein WC455_19265 [Dehalococcoidia bacterium]|jgi:hypothetical protein